jgi:HSP20 family protein
MKPLFKSQIFDVMNKAFEASTIGLGPNTKIHNNKTEYKIFISVPGLCKDDLKISTKDNILKISFESDLKDNKVVFVDNFIKLYDIPDDVKETDIIGKVENGILEVILPIESKKSNERYISLN